MLGIVFSEFTEMVEEVFSAEMVEKILDDCDLESGGAYTSVGSYSHTEIISLVGALIDGVRVKCQIKPSSSDLSPLDVRRWHLPPPLSASHPV